MKSLAQLLWGIAVSLLFALWLSGVATAQVSYDLAAYKALADSDSAATIPPGTRITLSNWQQYKKFMPIYMQAAYQGFYQYKVGLQPDYTVEVAPTIHYQMPATYIENTEKYAGQTRLVPLPTGGFNWSGYKAGLAFPNPTEPNQAVKMAYNLWADYRPRMALFYAWNWLVDRFGNVTNLKSSDAFYRLSHLSEPNFPIEYPFAAGVFYSSRLAVEEPEQSKYTTELTIQPEDPSRTEEIYVFLPSLRRSLRRSLRLSSSARCAPILGTDFIEDDNAWLPTNFKFTYIGKKKILTPITDYAKAFDHDSYLQPPAAFPGWPKASITKWQLRDYYVVDFLWLNTLGAYCYSDRAVYIDADNWVAPLSEAYDKGGKFWKVLWVIQTPIDYEGLKTLISLASISAVMSVDFQNSHITATVETPTTTNDQVPGEYADVQLMTSPGGLDRILK